MGSGGAEASLMVSYLNAHSNAGYASRWDISDSSIYYNLWYSIYRDYPVVAAVSQGILPNINNENIKDGHIIVIKGYYNEGQESMGGGFYFNDPHFNNAYYGSFSCPAARMAEAIRKKPNSHFYISA